MLEGQKKTISNAAMSLTIFIAGTPIGDAKNDIGQTACCSSASSRSRVSRPNSVSGPTTDELRRRIAFGATRLLRAAVFGAFGDLRPALERRLIAVPSCRVRRLARSRLFAHAAGAWRQHCCTKAACWVQPSRSEEERKKNVRAQAACARMLGQLDGIRDQDERVAEMR